ncbi:MAG: MATE family efflux transporter [Clostridia bacterium]|nr:MATE family efflux transporter [Clostridia bacterium]
MDSIKNDFSKGSVKRLILSQALPLTVAQMVQLLYNIIDRIYIGHLEDVGDLALTGLGITFPVIVIIAAFTSLFSTGGASLFSIARGKGENDKAESILGMTFTLIVSSSVILFVLCYFLRRPILFLFGASEDSFVFADEYLEIYLFGTLFSMLSTGLNPYINAQGFPRLGMMTTVIGAVLNVILDPVFIFLFDMGVRGAAIATVISQTASAIWVLIFLFGNKAILKIKRRNLKINPALLPKFLALGLPGFVMQATNSLVQIVCNNQLQHWGGDLYVGIITVLNSVREILTVPMLAISSGSQPVLGFNYGAGRNDRVKEGILFTAIIGAVYLSAAWIIVMLFPEFLMSVFSDKPQVISEGARFLNIYFFGFAFMTLQATGQSTFLALGKAKQAIFFSLLRKAFIVVPFTLLLPAIGFGVDGVFLAEPISNIIGGIAAFSGMWFMVYRKL